MVEGGRNSMRGGGSRNSMRGGGSDGFGNYSELNRVKNEL